MLDRADISVIIPVFNLEKYIGATLESVIAQQGVCLEVLVVDDHSTDNTRQVVEAYAAQYSFIRLLTNERTKGVSGARNTALQHMTGKTCFFLDGDDILTENALAPLFEYLQINNVPLVRSLCSLFCYQRWLCMKTSMPNLDLREYPMGYIVLNLYSAKFLKDNAIFFPEDITIGEDHIFFCQIFCLLEQETHLHTLNHYSYFYRINHKKFIPSTKSALSFIAYLTHVRCLLEQENKMHYFESCMRLQFASHWLNYAYYTLHNSKAIEQYLKDCATLFTEKKEVFFHILHPALEGDFEAFWQASEEHDTKKMLEILKIRNLLQPFEFSYIGIDECRVKSRYWNFFRTIARLKNISTNMYNVQCLWYIYTLQQKSKKILFSL